jgi:hypothetical protein
VFSPQSPSSLLPFTQGDQHGALDGQVRRVLHLGPVRGGGAIGLDNARNCPYGAVDILRQVGQAKSLKALNYGTPSGLTIQFLFLTNRASPNWKKQV